MATETKATALRAKSAQELKDELVELRKEEFNLRMQRGTGQLSNTARFKEIRREVARIKTILNEQAASA
ncbi:50S ribosomal protein L29 [Arenicella sp. 4NH20-0111]|uniref:50S ribosomal protein L29 n=1 Tax=Arenicella sp. 4NH20-0111 TaxID=3127648 RepID=UPI0031055EAE